jgi:ADP-ribose pyrophosphatase YjhB (NUDIX family)
MKRIKFGTNPNNKKQAVFVAFHGSQKVYENCEEVSEAERQTDIKLLFMVNRWDGKIGFPGGNVEDGETLREAAVREVKEELGYTVYDFDLEPVCSHDSKIVTHLFSVEVGYDTLVRLQKLALEVANLHTEITGTFLAHIMYGVGDYIQTRGLASLLQTALAPSVRNEMMVLFLKEKMVTQEQLEEAWTDTNIPFHFLQREVVDIAKERAGLLE